MEVPRTETSDAAESVDELLIEHLRQTGGCRVSELTERLGITATAVRQRLNRLMSEGLVEKSLSRHAASDNSARELKGGERQGRGRPSHQYRLTPKASRLSGDNFGDLAEALWAEVMSLPDSETQHAVVRRLAARLAARMAEQTPLKGASAQRTSAQGGSLTERMRAVSQMMRERHIPFSVDESGRLPVLMAHACPYPELAEKDRSVCTLEKAMISELLGEGVELSECKLDGGACCSFEPNDG